LADLWPVLASPRQSCHDEPVATPDLQRLAERIRERRLQLNLSARRAAERAEVARETWTRLEEGKVVRHTTYDKVEAALGWTIGSCRKVMEGGDAVLLDDTDTHSARVAPVPPEELEGVVSQAIQGAMVAGTDLTASKIREVNERALEILRSHGILPPASN
jgi:DNA-binding XRE family transcriptional regulator